MGGGKAAVAAQASHLTSAGADNGFEFLAPEFRRLRPSRRPLAGSVAGLEPRAPLSVLGTSPHAARWVPFEAAPHSPSSGGPVFLSLQAQPSHLHGSCSYVTRTQTQRQGRVVTGAEMNPRTAQALTRGRCADTRACVSATMGASGSVITLGPEVKVIIIRY